MSEYQYVFRLPFYSPVFKDYNLTTVMNRITHKYKSREGNITTMGHRVIENMENNPVFPDPPEALSTLKKLLPEFHQALADAQGGDRHLVSLKNDKKEIVLALLLELADY